MDKFNKAEKIANHIAKFYNTADIQNELYQLLILHHPYKKAVELSHHNLMSEQMSDLISELKSLIILLPASSITEMESSLKPI